jgi:alpha-tubulin suppressor-like RCC1 family protein
MKQALVAARLGAALLAVHVVEAQAPTAGTMTIRDLAPGAGVLVVKADGTVVTWGRSAGAAVPVPTTLDLPGKVLRVAVGGSNLSSFTGYAVLEDGTVVAWGGNDEGQLGTGAPGSDRPLGTYPKPSLTPVKVTGLANIIDIDAGNKHAIALRSDGTVWAWGARDDGALGGGDAKPAGSLRVVSAMAPVAVPGLVDITQIAVGPRHSLALTRDGHVMSWGSNGAGELGVGTRDTGWTPSRVALLDGVVAIAAGSTGSNGVSGAIRDDGTVWMWGVNASAMMGNGQEPTAPDDPGGRNPLPTQVKGLVGAARLSIGSGHVAVVLADGTLRMWGHNGYGELGLKIPGSYQTTPMAVPGLANVAGVYLGSMRSYAVRADGSLWIWGFSHSLAGDILGKHLRVPTRLDLP